MGIETETKEQKEKSLYILVETLVRDAVHDFLYTARKKDKDLTDELLAETLKEKVIPTQRIINWFADELRKEVGNG